jgi:hypothetical protein
MHATTGTDGKARVGDAFPALELAAASGQLVTVPDPAGDYGRHAYDQWTVDELIDHARPVSA